MNATITLSGMDRTYCPGKQHIEVSNGVSKVVYLQRVDGSGYDVSTLTPLEAIEVGKALIEAGMKAMPKKRRTIAKA